MNRTVQDIFQMLQQDRIVYENDTGNLLMAYRKRKEQITAEANKFKDETAYIEEHLRPIQEETWQGLRKTEASFRSNLKQCSAALHAELKSALGAPVAQELIDRVGFYRVTGLIPGRAEADLLLEGAKKHPLAVAAVKRLLKDCGSKWQVSGKDTADFENDIAALDKLIASPSLLYSPLETHTELVEICRGRPNGQPGGRTFGDAGSASVEFLTQRAGIVTTLDQLSKAGPAWAADVTYFIREIEDKDATEVAQKKAELTGEEYTPPEEPASTVEIRGKSAADDAISLARELGAENAAVTIPDRYVR